MCLLFKNPSHRVLAVLRAVRDMASWHVDQGRVKMENGGEKYQQLQDSLTQGQTESQVSQAEPGWEMLDSAEGAVGGGKEGQLVEEEEEKKRRYLKLVVTQLVIPTIALPSLQGGRRGKMLIGELTMSTTSPRSHSGSTPASRRKELQ